jgi:hypothetical protein
MTDGDRASEARELLAVYDAAAQSILGDPAVWAEESARTGALPLPWPLPAVGRGYPQLLRIFAVAAVQNVLDCIRIAHGAGAVPASDPADPHFQLILRVVKRAGDAADRALCERFGGTGRLSVKRELLKLVRERDAEAAVRSGAPRSQAFEQTGMSRAAAYRALRRSRTKR